MKNQMIKIGVLSVLCLCCSPTIQAQQYEEAQEENYTEDAVDQQWNSSSDYIDWHYNVKKNEWFTTTDEGTHYNSSIVYPIGTGNRVRNENSGSALGGIPDPLPDTPIDSNLYVLLFSALCYGLYQRRRLMILASRI